MNSNWSYGLETAKLGHDLCDLDLWPWPFAGTLLLSLVITPENFMMIRWWEHRQKGVMDGQTDRQTDWTIHRAAWWQLIKNLSETPFYESKGSKDPSLLEESMLLQHETTQFWISGSHIKDSVGSQGSKMTFFWLKIVINHLTIFTNYNTLISAWDLFWFQDFICLKKNMEISKKKSWQLTHCISMG